MPSLKRDTFLFCKVDMFLESSCSAQHSMFIVYSCPHALGFWRRHCSALCGVGTEERVSVCTAGGRGWPHLAQLPTLHPHTRGCKNWLPPVSDIGYCDPQVPCVTALFACCLLGRLSTSFVSFPSTSTWRRMTAILLFTWQHWMITLTLLQCSLIWYVHEQNCSKLTKCFCYRYSVAVSAVWFIQYWTQGVQP